MGNFAHKKSLVFGIFREGRKVIIIFFFFLYFLGYFSFKPKSAWKIPPPSPLLVVFLALAVLVQAPVFPTEEENTMSSVDPSSAHNQASCHGWGQ